MDSHSWWPVITSNLASSAVGRVVPGGAAAAGAMQFKMLVQAGVAPSLAGLGIAVAGIVVLAALAALPVLALPPIVLGLAVPDRSATRRSAASRSSSPCSASARC